jgi:glycosyltransferase involved in cell wall biosynthesis
MATFNGQKYIKEQLESILCQLSPYDEVIISDDTSTDNTIDIIKECKDARIKIISGPKLGVVKNFEHAIQHASGDVIFLTDQDDVWLSNKVEVSLKHLRNNILVVSDCMVTNSELDIISQSFFTRHGSRPGLWRNLIKNHYMGCCIAFNRELLFAALPFPKSLPMHDWWLGIVAECIGTVMFIDEGLILYRRHDSNVSDTSIVSKTSLATKLKWRFIIIKELFMRLFWSR